MAGFEQIVFGEFGIDIEGGPFRDEAADEALFTELRNGLSGTDVEIVELDLHINDPGFGKAMAESLHALISH